MKESSGGRELVSLSELSEAIPVDVEESPDFIHERDDFGHLTDQILLLADESGKSPVRRYFRLESTVSMVSIKRHKHRLNHLPYREVKLEIDNPRSQTFAKVFLTERVDGRMKIEEISGHEDRPVRDEPRRANPQDVAGMNAVLRYVISLGDEAKKAPFEADYLQG